MGAPAGPETRRSIVHLGAGALLVAAAADGVVA
jgi:hypothetical protein